MGKCLEENWAGEHTHTTFLSVLMQVQGWGMVVVHSCPLHLRLPYSACEAFQPLD